MLRLCYESRFALGIGLALLGAGGVCTAQPADQQPFYTSNMNPFVQIFGLPPVEGGRLLRRQESELHLIAGVANSSAIGSDLVEQVWIDGETYWAIAGLRHGLNNRVQLGIDVPYVSHTGGTFDRIVERFHEITGLPNGERDRQETNRLEYSYTLNGEDVYRVDRSASGLGDVRLSAAFALTGYEANAQRSVALHAGLKLPTGESSRLLGSGGTDFSLGVAMTDAATFDRQNLVLFVHGGLLFLGESDINPQSQRDAAGFANLGLAWSRWAKITIKAQLELHSALYDSELEELGRTAGQLVFGGSWTFSERVTWEFAATEDISVSTTPDIAFQSHVRMRF